MRASMRISGLRSAGSMIFDEISELDSACQRNLLYALPDGHGDSRRGTLEARVISTTSRNLDDEMRAGRFRAELYYRINGVCLRLPALRDRREDIPILVESFLGQVCCAVWTSASLAESANGAHAAGTFLARKYSRAGKCGEKNYRAR